MSEAATPAVPETPATPEAQPEVVTLTKEQYDEIATQAARAKESQSRADKLAQDLKRLREGGRGTFAQPAATPPETEAPGQDEIAKAERGILRLAVDPELREVLDADSTLRDLITTNPTALIPLYAKDALGAEDAVEIIKDKLLSRKSPPKAPEAPAPVAPAPPSGGVNTPDRSMEDAMSRAKSIQDPGRMAEAMIAAKLGLGK